MKSDESWHDEFNFRGPCKSSSCEHFNLCSECRMAIIREIQADAVCTAINKLFWKVPLPTELVWGGSREKRVGDVAGFWAGRLADVGIDVAWDREAQEFVPAPIATPDAPRGSGDVHLM